MEKTRKLGQTDIEIAAIGYGCMGQTHSYACVSTDSEEQLTSYEAQVDYYTNYIKSCPEWEFVDVYTDEGISATDTRLFSVYGNL